MLYSEARQNCVTLCYVTVFHGIKECAGGMADRKNAPYLLLYIGIPRDAVEFLFFSFSNLPGPKTLMICYRSCFLSWS